jgi:salicylate hydroxylase
MISYPISKGRYINVAAFDVKPEEENTHLPGPWVSKADPKHVAELFSGWEKEVEDIMNVSSVRQKLCG